jgi:hypothetical protein
VAYKLGSLGLGHFPFDHQSLQLDNESGFELVLLGIWQAEISEKCYLSPDYVRAVSSWYSSLVSPCCLVDGLRVP